MSNPFDYVNAINQSKEDLIRNSENPELAEKEYNAFLTNRQLSYFIDTVFAANDMNERHQLRSLLQFDYLKSSIRPRKRFSKWEKKQSSEDLDVIKEWYCLSDKKAQEILSILSKDKINVLREKLSKGGKK